MTQAETDVLAEREKQRAQWGDDHDSNAHDDEQLAEAAAILACPFSLDSDPDVGRASTRARWAYTLCAKHLHDRRRQLVIAGALILAEIDRLDRANPAPPRRGRTESGG